MSNFRFGLSFIDGRISRGVDHDRRLKLSDGLLHITRNTQIYLRLVQKKCLDRARQQFGESGADLPYPCLLYTSPSPRDYAASRMPSSA